MAKLSDFRKPATASQAKARVGRKAKGEEVQEGEIIPWRLMSSNPCHFRPFKDVEILTTDSRDQRNPALYDSKKIP